MSVSFQTIAASLLSATVCCPQVCESAATWNALCISFGAPDHCPCGLAIPLVGRLVGSSLLPIVYSLRCSRGMSMSGNRHARERRMSKNELGEELVERYDQLKT